jgi:hypothetical protein
MNRSMDDSNLNDLKREIEALRKRLEKMELEHGRPRRVSRRFRPRPAVAVLFVFVGFLVFLGVLGAQSAQQDALFVSQAGNVGIGTRSPGFPLTFSETVGDKIALYGSTVRYGFGIQPNLLQFISYNDKSAFVFGHGTSAKLAEVMRIKADGTVGIGTNDPKANLDVKGTLKVSGTSEFNGGVGINTVPLSGQNLVISPSNKSIPLNVTNPEKNINWLTVFADGRVIMNGADVGIGTTEPQSRLDVRGEIRGKPWSSKEYEWKRDQKAVQMSKVDRSVCFISGLSGNYGGNGEDVTITQLNGYWMLGGKSLQDTSRVRARCIGSPDDWK